MDKRINFGSLRQTPMKRKNERNVTKQKISMNPNSTFKKKLHKSHKKLTKEQKQQIFDEFFKKETAPKCEKKKTLNNKKHSVNGELSNKLFKSQKKCQSNQRLNITFIYKKRKPFTTHKDKLDTRKIINNHTGRSIEVNRNERIFHSNMTNCKQKKRQRNLISLTGFNRITDASYHSFVRLIWIVSYLLCLGGALYQCGKCIVAYTNAEPARKVEFQSFSEIDPPTIVTCPTLILGRNPKIAKLIEQYEHIYRTEPPGYSDLLKLPNVNMNTIWTMYEVNSNTLTMKITCSNSPNDAECAENFMIEEVLTSGGLCVTLKNKGFWKTYGAVTSIQLLLEEPKNFWGWNIGVMYMRAYIDIRNKLFLYNEVDFGKPLPYQIEAMVTFKTIEIFNVNWPKYPCSDSDEVEDCIDLCFENMLYSAVSCRLPFMKNYSLPDCNTPESFNQSYEITKLLLRKGNECHNKCPRKCHQLMTVLKKQTLKIKAESHIETYSYFDTKKLVIREYQWYSFLGLMADIGGILGFLIDFCLLNILEFIEFGITVVHSMVLSPVYAKKKIKGKQVVKNMELNRNHYNIKKKNFKVGLEETLKSTEESRIEHINIVIGITGFDRIFNKKCGIFRKFIWILSLFFCTSACIYQICDAIRAYQMEVPQKMLTTMKNDTIKYPALTICPFQPYEHYEHFKAVRESYRFDNNITDENISIPLSELLKVENYNISDYWETDGILRKMINYVDVNCLQTTAYEGTGEVFEIVQNEVYTLMGKCHTIKIVTLARYHGEATSTCVLLQHLPETTGPFVMQIQFHDHEDDPRTLNQNSGILLQRDNVGVVLGNFRKEELINTGDHPCSDSLTVAKCRSDCYDNILNEKAVCGLPFMKNHTKEFCNTPEAFNITMDTAFSIMRNYPEKWCNCPEKCSQYVFDFELSISPVPTLKVVMLIVNVANNIFLVTKEIKVLNVSVVFSQICGFLGFYLGFNILSLLEISEITLKFIKKIKKK